MYKIKFRPGSQVILKNDVGKQIHIHKMRDGDLTLGDEAFESLAKSVSALVEIGVLEVEEISDVKADGPESPFRGSVKAEKIARKLLAGEGLNHSSFTRAYGLDSLRGSDKRQTKVAYDHVLQLFEKDTIRQGHDYFWK